jgi:hypothetical protein
VILAICHLIHFGVQASFGVYFAAATFFNLRSLGGIVEGAHDIIISVDEEFLFTFEDNFAASVLGKEDGVSNLNVNGTNASVLHNLARTDGNDLTEVKDFTLVSGSEDDSTLGLGDGFSLLDNYTVEEGLEGLEGEH